MAAQAGEIARHASDANPGAVLVEGDVTDVVKAVLDLPVATVEREDLGRTGALGVKRAEPVGGLDAAAAGLEDSAVAHDAERSSTLHLQTEKQERNQSCFRLRRQFSAMNRTKHKHPPEIAQLRRRTFPDEAKPIGALPVRGCVAKWY